MKSRRLEARYNNTNNKNIKKLKILNKKIKYTQMKSRD